MIKTFPLIAITLLAMAQPAIAQTAGTADAALPAAKPANDDSAPELFAGASPIAEDGLKQATAREDLSLIAQSQQTSGVSNSSVVGTSTTGDVGISGNAFQNASGLTVVNANSGNNVAMNASLNVNIVVTPAQ